MGRWIDREEGWLGPGDRVEPGPVPVEPPAPAAPAEDLERVVIWVPVFCPHCHSRDCPVVATLPARPGMRYHSCRTCGVRFKSFERDPQIR